MQAGQQLQSATIQAGDDLALRCANLGREVEELKLVNQRYLALGLAWKKRFEVAHGLLVKTMEDNANDLKSLHDLMVIPHPSNSNQ